MKRVQPKRVSVLNTFDEPERKKRKTCLLDDEEPVIIEEDDDEIKKKYIHRFRMSYKPSNTLSKSQDSMSALGTQLLSTSECVDVEYNVSLWLNKKMQKSSAVQPH
nr:unnamed protein product [Callosobruchus analis]